MRNLIDTIHTLVQNPVTELKEFYKSKNRANSMGDALEEYVKDLFADTLTETNEAKRLQTISQTFSYLGNQNNPPDMILRGGDAIEGKKIEGKNASLALNSSYPKHKLYANSSLLTEACRNCEDWTEKDIIYIVGVVNNTHLNSLCMVYGMDYAADSTIYQRIKHTITDGISQIPYVDFAPTNELAKVKKVDPLGITDLRVRGMWSIANPFRVFESVYQRDTTKSFHFMCIINAEKWKSFANTALLLQDIMLIPQFQVSDIDIPNPDNPAQLKPAKLITLELP